MSVEARELDVEVGNLRASNESLENTIRELERTLKDVEYEEKDNERLRAAVRDMEHKWTQSERHVKELEEDIEQMKGLEARVAEWEAARKEGKAMHKQSSKENVFLKRQIRDMRLKMAELADQLQQSDGKQIEAVTQKLLGYSGGA